MAGLNLRWRRGGSRVDVSPADRASGVSTIDLAILLTIAAIVLFALAARLYNVNWDEGSHIHPDERHLTVVTAGLHLPGSIGEYFDSDTSRLNPYNLENAGSFVYGTLPVFMTKATAAVFGQDDYDDIVLVGRRLSALFGAATVLLVFFTARRLYGVTAGLLGAVLLAAAPLAIQHSHFYVVDTFLVFFMAAALYFAVRIVQEGRAADYGLTGLMLGLAVTCKITALLFVPVLLVAVAMRLWPLLKQRWTWQDEMLPPLMGLAAALAIALLAFRVVQPYAFDTPDLSPASWFSLDQHWVDDEQQQERLLGGEVGFPPSVQWIGRTPYVYPLTDMLRWGMAPAFGIAGWLAFAYAGYRAFRFREARHLLPLVFVIVYFGFMGRQFSLYMRYFLPLYPVLAVLAGYGLVELLNGARAMAQRFRRPALHGLGVAVAGIVLLGALLAGLAYVSIYGRGFTRADATRWMYANIPAGSTIAGEQWDETLPIGIPGLRGKQYQVIALDLYGEDTPNKEQKLINDLSRADYVTVSSNRLMNSIPRNPINYPLTSHYYEMLQSGDLGFDLVKSFTSYPGLLGIDFPDYRVQESWSSYDHPRVLVYKKSADFSTDKLQALLSHGPYAAASLPPGKVQPGQLLLSQQDLATQTQGGTWTDVFSDSGIAHSNPTLIWLIALEAAAFAATPLAMWLFRRLPDRGYLLAKPLGLLLVAYPVWLIVSLKLVHFDQTSILAVLIGLLAVGAAVGWRRREELLAFVRANWRLILFSELLFLVAFFVFRELRMQNPDLWETSRGGEKPMDLAYLTAVARSTTLPPYDPWFAGGYINYYYLGQFFTATLTKLTTIPPEVAYNLAVPTFFALTVAGAFSVSYNLAAAARGLLHRTTSPPGGHPADGDLQVAATRDAATRDAASRAVARIRNVPGWSPYAAGILGAFLVAVAGNLDGIGQMVTRLSAVSATHADTSLPLVDSIVNSIGGAWQVVFHGANLAPFDYWRSSRMMPPSISITEFPFFSFLFADLHAHVMAIAFQVLTIGVCLALVLRKRGERDNWRDLALVALLGLIVGSLRWLNSWDYPPFLLLALTAVLISERYLDGGAWPAVQRVVLRCGLLAGLSFLLYEPFLANYRTPVSGVISAPETTPVHQYLAHFGLFAAVIGAWLLFWLQRFVRPSRIKRLFSLHSPDNGVAARSISAGLFAAGCLLSVLGIYVLIANGRALVGALIPVMLVVLFLGVRELTRRREDGGLRLLVLALIGLGLGLSMGVDIVTLKGDIVRMNTVFKFYLHIWVVFALAASFAAWQLVFVIWRPGLLLPARRLGSWTAQAGLAGLGLLLISVLIYPLFATGPRLDDRFADLPPTLDGEAYMRTAVYPDQHGPIDLHFDLEGIQWLRQNVQGTPAIVEGRTPLYRWGGRFSIYTGLPAVLGWDWHQTQQRGDMAFMVAQRAAEVDSFYNDPDVARALDFLREYDVHYVIVGQVERYYYQREGLAKFADGLGGAIDPVFKNAQLTIYEVQPGVLDGGDIRGAFLDHR